MGPERWQGEIELRKFKVACPDYIAHIQAMPFQAWMMELAQTSKRTDVLWASDAIRADYYENQPETWLDSYDNGDSPSDAIAHDMEAWEAA